MGEHRHTDLLETRPAPAPCTPEAMIGLVLAARREGDPALASALEALPAPVYLTDRDGWITHFNAACVAFAGRTPEPGRDRWCVSARLYNEGGAWLAHGEGPLAIALQERVAIRGALMVAERPDGSRITFLPYPTPLLDDAGEIAGAVNVLIDITDQRQPDALIAQAVRCRRLADSVTDKATVETLLKMAADYEIAAETLRAAIEGG